VNSIQKKASRKLFPLILILSVSLMVSVFSGQVSAQTSGTVMINNGATYTNSASVVLTLSATNATQMCFSNDNSSWSSWETYATTKNWVIPTGDGYCTVYVQFQDSGNQTAAATALILVDQTPPDVLPYADFVSSDFKTVYFDASESTDNVGIKSYTWNFGDGNTTSGITLTHTYAIGSYVVNLTVQDLAGNTASITFNVTIPDASTFVTATPAPTAVPTVYPIITQQPTITASPAPISNGLDVSLIFSAVLVLVIVVVVLAIIILRKKSPKQATPTTSASPTDFTV
jgi:hypothetical protein